jgi:hypothetical protein
MTGFIIAIILILFGCYLMYRETFEGIGLLIILFSLFFLIIHTYFICFRNFEFEKFLSKRIAIEETLKSARKTKNNIELMSITNELIEHNKELAEIKFMNNTLSDVYIDDRFMYLKPIK